MPPTVPDGILLHIEIQTIRLWHLQLFLNRVPG